MNRMHFLLLLIFSLPNLAKSQVAIIPDPDLVWFKPELVVANDQICAVFHEDAIEKFLAPSPLRTSYYRRGNSEPEFLGMQALSLNDPTITSQTGAVPSLIVDGKPIFLRSSTNRGCGGACETYQLVASVNSTFEGVSSNNLTLQSPYGFQLYQDQLGAFWVLVLDGDDKRLLVYKVPTDGLWETACEVNFKPENFSEVVSVNLQPALQAIERLRFRVENVLGTEGSCGSSSTLTRWTSSLRQNLPAMLYQPWKSAEAVAASDSPYDKDLENLKDWSLFGISEFNAFQAYLAELDKSVAAFAEFYADVYGWSKEESEHLAYAAATTTIGNSIRFYDFGVFLSDESEVRRAILTGMSLENFKALSFDFSKDSGRSHAEKIVSLAINSPDLLQYILSEGGDANSENDFGKTPLMYAAQNNNLEAVRILLAAGANPNATTRRGTDDCYFNLSTLNMTPLHYAVRYASPELIKLLLDEGAASYITSQGMGAKTNANVLDWLRIYTTPAALEINPNIPEDTTEQVAAWLEPPTPEVLAKRVTALVLEGESLYQSGEIVKAYQRIALALQIAPDNERAISDMSLIALRNGKLGSTLEASQKLIAGEFGERLKANAWFNQGLACEAYGKAIFSYNGRYHCGLGILFPFQKALALENTDARKNKLLQLFENNTIPYCLLPDENGEGMSVNFQSGTDPEIGSPGQGAMISVLHSKSQNIQAEALAWNMQFSNSEEKTITPEHVRDLDLGAQVLSVFKAAQYPRFPHSFSDYVCETPDDPDASVTQETRSGSVFKKLL